MKFLCALFLASGLVLPVSAQTGFVNDQAARGVIGQATFEGGADTVSASVLAGAQGVAVGGNWLFVADSNVLSILNTNYTSTTLSQAITNVASTTIYVTSSAGMVANSTVLLIGTEELQVSSVSSDGHTIGVVRGYDSTTAALASAGAVVTFSLGATQDNRVLAFNTTQLPAPTANLVGLQPARCPLCDLAASNVIGQPNFTSQIVPATLAANSVNQPTAVATDGTILAVADTNNNRVLVYNTIPTTPNASANVVLGQPDFVTFQTPDAVTASTLRGPQGLWIQNGKLFVADTQNSRILIWNSIPTTNNQPADLVLGEPNFTTRYIAANPLNPATSANSLYDPVSVSSDGTRLFVSDLGNNRVLIWNEIPTANQQPADVEVGQPDMTSNMADNVTGILGNGNTTTSTTWVTGGCASTGTDTAVTPNVPTYNELCERTLSFPRFALSDGTRLFIADGGNDRVLIYATIPTVNGAAADTVLGQVDMITNIVSDETQLITSTVVSNNSSADTIRTPTSLAWDGTNLYVADPFDNRVLYFTPGSPNLILPNDSILNAASLLIYAQGYVIVGLNSGDSVTTGDVITVTIGGTAYTYTVQSGDTLAKIVAGLVKVINGSNSGAGDPNVIAIAAPNDTLSLQSKVAGPAGNSVTLAASLTTGTAETVTVSDDELTGGNSATLAPGSLVVINAPPGVVFASDGETHTDNDSPLDVDYAGVQVYFDGIAAPIAYVTPTQIRAQIPYLLFSYTQDAAANSSSAYVRLQNPDGSVSYSNAIPLAIVPANPGIFSMNNGTPPTALAFHGSNYASAVFSIDGTINAGDIGTVVVGNNTYTYTVQSTDTLNTIQTAFVNLINQDPLVTATASGTFTRVVIQARVPGPAGNGIPLTASVDTGADLLLTVLNTPTCCSNTAGAPVTAANPLVPNELFYVWGDGLGIITGSSAATLVAGAPYNGAQPNTVNDFVAATLEGGAAQVINSGLPTGVIGLYQVELQVPAGATTSDQAELYIAQDAYISNITLVAVNSASISLSPNPIAAETGTHGTTTVTYSSSVANTVVYVGSQLFCTAAAGTSSGTCTTGDWVSNGMVFSLVDPSTGVVLATTTAVVQAPAATLTLNPNPVGNDGTGLGTATLTVNANTPVNVYAGPTEFVGDVTTGAFATGKWVSNGLVFTAVDVTSSKVIGSVTAQVSKPAGTLTFASNPILNTNTPGDVVATLNYSANIPAAIYVNGTLFCGGGTAISGSCTTGQWVTNGMQFQLVAVATKAVLATATAQVELSAGTGTITLSPNPAVVTDGTGLATITVGFSASAPNAGIFVNGTLLCTGQSGYCPTGKWVHNGMVFTLANTANGLPIASATAVVQTPSATISLAQNPVVAAPGSNAGIATINYSANVGVEVLVGGKLLCGPQLSGSCLTGTWVTNGMVFQLVDAATQVVLASVTAQVVPPSGQISLTPNPVVVTDGSGLGVATVNYTANVPVAVFVGPNRLCGDTTTSGSCLTGKWVSNGLVFSLVETGTDTVLATVTASVVSGP
jgi:LysM repeat protein